MNVLIQAPACHLRWTVTRVAAHLYAVAATKNGADYDFVGNFKSLKDAHRAGRRYAEHMAHQSRQPSDSRALMRQAA